MPPDVQKSPCKRRRTFAQVRRVLLAGSLVLSAVGIAGCDLYRKFGSTGECDTLRVVGMPPGPVVVGDTVRLSVSLRDSMNRPVVCLGGRIAQWTSSAPQVITVSSDGLLQALTAGESVITARQDRRTRSVTVRVIARSNMRAGRV